MKNKSIFIIVIFCAITLIAVGVFLSGENNASKNKASNNLYDIKEIERIKTCYTEDCIDYRLDLYATMSYDYDSKVIQDIIKKFNKQVKSDYNEAKNSDMSDPSCASLAPYNEHSIRYDIQYHSYTSEDIIYFALKRNRINICTRSIESYQVDAYYYDIKTDKIINQKDLLKKIGYSEEDLNYTITTELASLKARENIEVEYKEKYDSVIYANTKGTLYVSFYVESLGTHHVTKLIKK